ncbi:MAG: integrin alpha, partial [Candidatus Hydrogenedentes bacterium]|nr:integrin alpha [Candidatus Hydrogenedentota bacterium]
MIKHWALFVMCVSFAVVLSAACLLAGPAAWAEVAVAPMAAPMADPPAGVSAGPPAGVAADWWGQVQKDIAAGEYAVTWQDETVLPEVAGAYQAPNRAQDLRTYFTEAGPRVVRRTSETPEWVWGLELLAIGDCGLPIEDAPPVDELRPNGNRIEYRRGDVVEWYVNADKGLEQGFTINTNPAGGESLVVSLAVRGDLTPGMMPDGETVEFLTPGGVGIIHYGQLKAYDANGTELCASLGLLPNYQSTIDNQQSTIAITVDVSGAVFPITIDPLATSAAWTAESDQVEAFFGNSVSTAGDVNGDGYADVIVGAYWYDNGETNEGRAFVYHGSASGLLTTAAWTAESDQASSEFGYSVSTAGDVNGDGYADIIVGAHRYDNGQTNEGGAFVWFGSASGLGANGTPVNADWSAESDQDSAEFGNSVSTAGDV